MSDDNSDYELSESVNRLRGAGANFNEAIEHLYYGTKNEVKNLHPGFQVGIAVVMWFGGNWVYNRIKAPVLDALTDIMAAIPAKFLISPRFGLTEAVSMPVWVQLLGMLSGVIITQNRLHTRKLKKIGEEIETMSDGSPAATDGGTRRTRTTGGPGVGGAIAGGFAGASFGPGGVLAGAFLGYLISEEMFEEGANDRDGNESTDPFRQNDDQR